MIEELLPANVVAVDTREDWPEAVLFAQERDALGAPVEKRRREFITARACARHALVRLGYEPVAIPVGRYGQPCWPAGVVGSITHCAGYRACALALERKCAAIGIDAEPHAPLPPGVLEQVTLPAEHAALCALSQAQPTVCWDRLVFTAKEAVYKTWFGLTGQRLTFTDALIAFDPVRTRFRAQLCGAAEVTHGTPSTLAGRWLVRDGLLLSAITLARA